MKLTSSTASILRAPNTVPLATDNLNFGCRFFAARLVPLRQYARFADPRVPDPISVRIITPLVPDFSPSGVLRVRFKLDGLLFHNLRVPNCPFFSSTVSLLSLVSVASRRQHGGFYLAVGHHDPSFILHEFSQHLNRQPIPTRNRRHRWHHTVLLQVDDRYCYLRAGGLHSFDPLLLRP